MIYLRRSPELQVVETSSNYLCCLTFERQRVIITTRTGNTISLSNNFELVSVVDIIVGRSTAELDSLSNALKILDEILFRLGC